MLRSYDLDWRLPALLVLLAALLVLLWTPARVGPDVPLNWDQSSHGLRAELIAASLDHGDSDGLVAELRRRSLYPPGYYFLLGVWIALFGDSLAAVNTLWIGLQLLAALGIALGFRSVPERSQRLLAVGVTAILLYAHAQYAALSRSYLLDAPAASLVVFALGLLAWSQGEVDAKSDRVRNLRAAGRLVLVAVVGGGLVLTKYSVGLPLLVSAGVLIVRALLQRRCCRGFGLLSAAVVIVAVGAGFLTWQDDGWRSFVDFARNRSNTADWSWSYRAWQYLRIYVEHNHVHWSCAVLLGGLVVAGARRWRDPFWLATASYALATLLVLSRHPYFLSRAALGFGVTLVVLAGHGALVVSELCRRRSLRAGRAAWIGLASLACLLVVVNRPVVTEQTERLYPADNLRLAPVSRYLHEVMAEQPSCRVIGAFNNFSPAWIQSLWLRAGPDRQLTDLKLDYDYPLAKDRGGWNADPDPAYARTLDASLSAETVAVIIAIAPYPDSCWYDRDYRLWNAWKRNYLDLLSVDPRVRLLASRDFDDAGVQLCVFGLVDALAPH